MSEILSHFLEGAILTILLLAGTLFVGFASAAIRDIFMIGWRAWND